MIKYRIRARRRRQAAMAHAATHNRAKAIRSLALMFPDEGARESKWLIWQEGASYAQPRMGP